MKRTTNIANALVSARYRLGLTQKQMALHLGISVSMIKLVETNRRTLSSASLIKLAALEIQLAAIPLQRSKALPAAMQDIVAAEQRKLEQENRFRTYQCEYQAGRFEKKLQKMEEDHESLAGMLVNLEELEKGLEVNSVIHDDLQQTRNKLVKKAARCNLLAQARLRNKIVLLRADAALLKSIHPRYVHTNEKPTIISHLKKEHELHSLNDHKPFGLPDDDRHDHRKQVRIGLSQNRA